MMNYMPEHKGQYKNHTLQDNEEIEIEYCDKCGCYTLNLITYNDITMCNYECIRCKERLC